MVERWVISAFEELRLAAKVKPVVLNAEKCHFRNLKFYVVRT